MRMAIKGARKRSIARAIAMAAMSWCGSLAQAQQALALQERGGSQENNDQDAGDDERIRIGFRIAPVKLSLEGLDRQLVGLGSYLVNAVGGCNDCHTNPPYARGHNPYCGEPKQVNSENYLAGGMEFGPFVSRNLTPEKDGLPAGLNYCEFSQEMRTGIDLEQKHPELGPLLQVMPWPVYQEMEEREMRAMYEYLRAIPPAEPGKAGPPGCPSGD